MSRSNDGWEWCGIHDCPSATCANEHPHTRWCFEHRMPRRACDHEHSEGFTSVEVVAIGIALVLALVLLFSLR